MEIFQSIGGMPLFKGIELSRLEELFATVHFKLQKHDKEQLIATKGEPIERVLLLIKGTVRTEIWQGEKVTQVATLDAPKLLAPSFIFGSQNRYPVSVVSNTEVEIIQLSRAEFQQMLHCNQQMMVNFLNVISSRTQFLAQRIDLLSLRTIKQKLAKYLLTLAGEHLQNFELPMTQSKLAEYFAVARPPLTKAFAELVQAGAIRMESRVVYVLNKSMLEEFSR
ncbi:MAG: Crp/Fnr family transcriptional regulator [Mangrovibacterium sp.]